MPRKPKRSSLCYWILCYYPPLDWRSKFEIRQVDMTKLTPEVATIVTQALGKMPQLGALKAARRAR